MNKYQKIGTWKLYAQSLKRDPTRVDNFREISLLDAVHKLLSIAILNRLEKYGVDILSWRVPMWFFERGIDV